MGIHLQEAGYVEKMVSLLEQEAYSRQKYSLKFTHLSRLFFPWPIELV